MAHIYLTETETPQGGYQMFLKAFTEMPTPKIEDLLQKDLQEFASVGYNSFTFHRKTGTVSIRKIEVKTLGDVFMTDQYGLLK